MGGRKRRVALEAAVESRASGTAFLATHHRSRQTVMRSNARPAQRNARVGGQIKELISLIERLTWRCARATLLFSLLPTRNTTFSHLWSLSSIPLPSEVALESAQLRAQLLDLVCIVLKIND